MMLAKLSGRSRTTHSSSVTTAGDQQRHQRQQHIADAAQRDPQQQRDRRQREDAGLDEGAHDRVAGLEQHHRRAGRIGLDRQHGGRRTGAARRCRRGRPSATPEPGRGRRSRPSRRLEIGRHRRGRDRLRRQRAAQIGDSDSCSGATTAASARWRARRVGLSPAASAAPPAAAPRRAPGAVLVRREIATGCRRSMCSASTCVWSRRRRLRAVSGFNAGPIAAAVWRISLSFCVLVGRARSCCSVRVCDDLRQAATSVARRIAPLQGRA